MKNNAPSDRTRVKRLPKRGIYDKDSIHRILDEGLVAHVGFVVDGQPYVVPTAYARDGERLLLHGSAASRMLRALASGADCCVTVTLTDALVLARSAFHHSMNYRSVVVLGCARAIEDPDAKMDAFKRFFDAVIPGRWDDVRLPNDVEMKQTLIVELAISEASAKARTEGAKDDDEDYALPVWAGLIPLTLTPAAPISDDRLLDGVATPDYATKYTRKRGGAADTLTR
jgi:nitroimidazol reductase NimA-like FMN-containing flavoprotein (pyridoxamine 5'-phosphate oxidase superfamily)